MNASFLVLPSLRGCETTHLGQGTLARLQDPKAKSARYRPPDSLLHFLTTL